MIIESLKSLYNRDLNKLKFEIESYKNEESIWKIDKNIWNSAGNLCLHLVGISILTLVQNWEKPDMSETVNSNSL